MQTKMNFGHPKWLATTILKWQEMQEKLVSFRNLGPFILCDLYANT
jgi:hypothetical protein